MKHRRGIELTGRESRYDVVYLGPLLEPAHTCFEDIPEWHALGGHCGKCESTGWLNRWDLSRKWGQRTFLGSLSRRLRCRSCGNKEGNKWILGKLPR